MMLHVAAADYEVLKEAGQRWGMETALAAVQILDQTVSRMRYSTQVRTLVEIALVRICQLEDLDALPTLIAQLRDGALAAPATSPPPQAANRPAPAARRAKEPAQKKSGEATQLASNQGGSDSPKEASDSASVPSAPLTEDSAEQRWQETLTEIGGMTAEIAGSYTRVAISAPNQLVVQLKAAYNKEWCDRPDVKRKIEEVMSRLTGRDLRIDFATLQEAQPTPPEARSTKPSRLQRMRELEQHPLVQEAMELFDAEVIRVEERRDS
jgi:DNA polymerase-3 subunit gamma/tau